MREMERSRAELIAAEALEFVASQEKLLDRFMALSGLSLGQLRDRIQDPALHAGALSFLLDHEPDAAAFCCSADLDPGLAEQARLCVARDSDEPWQAEQT